MPRNRFFKGNRKNQEENLYSEVDEAAVRPRTIPAPKLKTVEFDYRNNRGQLYRNLERSKSERAYLEATETDSSQEQFKNPIPPRMRKLPTRNYTRTNPSFGPNNRTIPVIRPTRQPPTTATPTRPFTRHTPPASLPNRYCHSYRPPPTPPRRDYKESYTYSVNTEEPTTLIGDRTRRVYAKIPEQSAIRADSHLRGPPGQVTWQETRSTQTTDPWLCTFQRSFANMKL
jgi:hypothetical protein